MYDVIYNIINHALSAGDYMQSEILFICGALIIVLTCVFIDMVYRIFSHFWRG